MPLALTVAGPLIVNILLFHALMDPAGIVPGLVVTALWFVVFWQFRTRFLRNLFSRRTIRWRLMSSFDEGDDLKNRLVWVTLSATHKIGARYDE